MAIIRMNKMNRTKQALADAGFPALTASKVVGRGKGQVDFKLLRGAEAGAEEAIAQLGSGPRLIPKRLITLVVPGDRVGEAIRTILSVNSEGRPGDGKIFVLPVIDAIRVRTGEAGADAVNEAAL